MTPVCAPGSSECGRSRWHAAFLFSHLCLRSCQRSESVPEFTLMILGKLKLSLGSGCVQRLHWIASGLIEGSPARHILQAVWVPICGEGSPVALHAGCQFELRCRQCRGARNCQCTHVKEVLQFAEMCRPIGETYRGCDDRRGIFVTELVRPHRHNRGQQLVHLKCRTAYGPIGNHLCGSQVRTWVGAKRIFLND